MNVDIIALLYFMEKLGKHFRVEYRFCTRCVCRIWARSFLLFTYLCQLGLGKHESCFTCYYL